MSVVLGLLLALSSAAPAASQERAPGERAATIFDTLQMIDDLGEEMCGAMRAAGEKV